MAAMPAAARRAPAATCVTVSQTIEGAKPPSSLSTAAAPVAHSTTERRPRRSARTRARRAGRAESSTDSEHHSLTEGADVHLAGRVSEGLRQEGGEEALHAYDRSQRGHHCGLTSIEALRRCPPGQSHFVPCSPIRAPASGSPPQGPPPQGLPPLTLPPLTRPPTGVLRTAAPARAFPSEWRSGRASSHDHQGRPTVSSTT